jgi:hypothetical protein
MPFDPAVPSEPFQVTFDRQSDPALPPHGAANLRRLRQMDEDAFALVPPFDAVHQASIERVQATQRLDRLLEHPSRGGFGLAEGDMRVVRQREEVARLSTEAERLRGLYETRGVARQAIGSLRRACETRLQDLPAGMMWQDWDGSATLRKGEDLLAGIRRVHGDVERAKARLSAIERAPLPVSHTKPMARAQIERLAAAGAPDVMGLVRGYADEICFPDETRRVEIRNVEPQQGAVPIGFVEVSAVTAMLAHLFKPQLLTAVEALLEQSTDHEAALSPEQRERATAVTATHLLLAQRHLASLTWQAIDQGLAVTHAADADPLAVLGLEIVPAPSRPPIEPQWPMVIERVGV